MIRKAIPTNIKRELWAQCGGYCQNPDCNKYLFANIEGDLVSLADIAHIIGAGKTGPRSEHELARVIQKDGLSNLIMLCLDCHKTVDELEHKFSVEEMQLWKTRHFQRIQATFVVPTFSDEQDLLKEVNDLLDENRFIFETYGPFSKFALTGNSDDTIKIWKRRCLDTILPNNQRIIDIFEKNKRSFAYPWAAYRQMLSYKMHADSFRENCLFDEKVNDYKLFPQEFDYYVKSKLGIQAEEPESRDREEIDFRSRTIDDYIDNFLANHSFIRSMKKWNICIFEVQLINERLLRIFVTNTYYFTEYTFEKIVTVDPNIDAIICSTPYSTYSEGAKRLCIENKVGLFMLGEFMGAIRYDDDKFLNYLVSKEKRERIEWFAIELKKSQLLQGQCTIYLFGSYLRNKVYDDIDIILVYNDNTATSNVDALVAEVKRIFHRSTSKLDFTICTKSEFSKLVLKYDNLEKVL